MLDRTISLAQVPPIPADAESEATGGGIVVYDHGLHRWRLDASGRVIDYIEYYPIDERFMRRGVPWKRTYHA